MSKKILLIDIIITVFIISLFELEIISYADSNIKSIIFIYIFYIFAFLKCIFGIIILLLNIINKNKEYKSIKYMLFLFPSIVSIVLYICSFYEYIIRAFNKDKIYFQLIYNLNNSRIFFPSFSFNIIISIVIIIGTFSWILYWTFYNKKINKIYLILINILTPICLHSLFFNIRMLFHA
jgi:hypothetical protein